MTNKYSFGTKLVVLQSFTDNRKRFKVGQIIELVKGILYEDSYEIEGHKEVGWANSFIDNEKRFRKVITSWKNEFGGKYNGIYM